MTGQERRPCTSTTVKTKMHRLGQRKEIKITEKYSMIVNVKIYHVSEYDGHTTMRL